MPWRTQENGLQVGELRELREALRELRRTPSGELRETQKGLRELMGTHEFP